MSDKTKNLARVAEIREIVKAHPIGGKLKESKDKFTFRFTKKHNNLDGVSVNRKKGEAIALKQLSEYLDHFHNMENEHTTGFIPIKTF